MEKVIKVIANRISLPSQLVTSDRIFYKINCSGIIICATADDENMRVFKVDKKKRIYIPVTILKIFGNPNAFKIVLISNDLNSSENFLLEPDFIKCCKCGGKDSSKFILGKSYCKFCLEKML